MMRKPFEKKDIILETKFNIIECFDLMKLNLSFSLEIKKFLYKIIKNDYIYNNWDEWMREVIWYGHRSGKYTCKIIRLDIGGNAHKKEQESNIIGNSYIV